MADDLITIRRFAATWEQRMEADLASVLSGLSALGAKLDDLAGALQRNTQQEMAAMATLSEQLNAELSDLATRVTEIQTVEASTEAVLTDLTGRIGTAIANLAASGVTPDQLSQLQALSDAVAATKDKLAAAVAAVPPAPVGP